MTTRLEKIYKEQVVPKLMERFGYKNPDAGAAPDQDHAHHGRGRGRG